MRVVSFPGLGIEEIAMERVAFSLFGIDVNWYGLIITCGMVLSVLYAIYHARMERVRDDDVIDLALYLIIFGVLGARLYYVLMEFDSYLVTSGSFFSNIGKTLYNMIAIWNGGLAIYGGIIGGFLAALYVARRKRIRFPIIADIAGPSVLVGQIIGRWGNFVNIEAFGSVTDLPWRMCSPTAADYLYYRCGLIDADTYQQILDGTLGVHPTFLYESLWNLFGLILITLLYKKKKFHGQMFLFYLVWYGFGRMLIEGLRTDSLMIGAMRVSQFVGLATFLVGMTLMIRGLLRVKKKTALAGGEYTPLYNKENKKTEVKTEEENHTITKTEEDKNGKAD